MSLPGIIFGLLATYCLLYLLFWDYLSLQLYQSFHYFGSALCFTLTGTDIWFASASVTLSDKLWPAAQLNTSMVLTILKLLKLTTILKTSQYKFTLLLCYCRMQNGFPPFPSLPPRLSTMCEGLIRNWYRRDNGCLVLCFSPTEILSLSAASTPSPACLLALSSSPSWDLWPI